MSEFNPKSLAMRAFLQLRRQGIKLGVGEYLAALEAIDGGFGDRPEELAQTLKLLWCHRVVEKAQFDRIWQALQSQRDPTPLKAGELQDEDIDDEPEPEVEPPIERTERLPELPQRSPSPPKATPQLSPLPVQAPLALVSESDQPSFQTYFPLSRRSMVYNWRYLRRPVANGPRDVVDIPQTVEDTVRQGFFLSPSYRRREQNEAKLLMLLDQNGSMMPFHRFTRDLVETLETESSLRAENVNVFYFQNIPRSNVYLDPYLVTPVDVEELFTACESETGVLIVSDAGAARGHRQMERIQTTTKFLLQLRQQTKRIAWLNPMPEKRWRGSSAEIIAKLIPMFQMDDTGFSKAIAIIRGQPLHPYMSPFL